MGVVWTVCLRLLPTASQVQFEPRPFCAWVQRANHSATEPPLVYITLLLFVRTYRGLYLPLYDTTSSDWSWKNRSDFLRMQHNDFVTRNERKLHCWLCTHNAELWWNVSCNVWNNMLKIAYSGPVVSKCQPCNLPISQLWIDCLSFGFTSHPVQNGTLEMFFMVTWKSHRMLRRS